MALHNSTTGLSEGLYSRKSAAQYLELSLRTVDYMIAKKRLKVRRISNRVRIPAEELRRFKSQDHLEKIA